MGEGSYCVIVVMFPVTLVEENSWPGWLGGWLDGFRADWLSSCVMICLWMLGLGELTLCRDIMLVLSDWHTGYSDFVWH